MRTKKTHAGNGGSNVIVFPKCNHGWAASVGASTIPHSELGAQKPRARSASCITTKVSAGNLAKPFQLKAAPYVRPVSEATAGTPPSSLTTSAVVVSSRSSASMESVNNPNSLDMQCPNLIDTKKFGDAASFGAMADAGTDEDEDVAVRCRVLTTLYAQGNSRAFAGRIGISPTRWNNIENGGALSKDVARLIVRRFPEVSLDWLWRGKDWALSAAKSAELHAAYNAVLVTVTPVPIKKKAPARKRRNAS